jgi:magnesium transporter
VIVDVAVYRDGRRVPGVETPADAWRVLDSGEGFVWLGLHEPSAAEFDDACTALELPALAVEDAIKAHQRPKLEVYDDVLFVVLRTACYDQPSESVEFGEILCFVGPRHLVAVRHGAASDLRTTRAALEARPELLARGPSAVLYGILDQVVDDYGPVVDGIEDDIAEVEDEVFRVLTANPVSRIYNLKREVILFRRAVHPLALPLERLVAGRLPSVDPGLTDYFRDVLDHVARVQEQVESMDDLLTNVLSANLTQVGVRQNDDMRRISAWAAMLILPTLLASVYGMNFDKLPGAHNDAGFALAVGSMIVIVTLMYRSFRSRGWL